MGLVKEEASFVGRCGERQAEESTFGIGDDGVCEAAESESTGAGVAGL